MDWIQTAIRRAAVKTRDTLENLGEEFPHSSDGVRWQTSPVRGWEETYGDWTAGFWPGVCWHLHALTGESRFAEAAVRHTRLLAPRCRYPSHDLGFLFYPSCALGYDRTGEPWMRRWALEAADTLVGLYRLESGWIHLRGSEDWAAIDTMMNLPLLWWAHRETGRERYRDVAQRHAGSTAEHLVRPDGSTWHVLRWDESAAAPGWRGTWQGLADDSCWSRGQAWALAGFVWARESLGTTAYDETLERLLRFTLANAPADGVPPWDYRAQGTDAPKDSSAAAITAAALLRLGTGPVRWRGTDDVLVTGLRRLHTLATRYAAAPGIAPAGLLRDGCFHAPRGVGLSVSLVFGDFFFLDALATLARVLQDVCGQPVPRDRAADDATAEVRVVA